MSVPRQKSAPRQVSTPVRDQTPGGMEYSSPAMSKFTRKEFLGFGATLAGATGFASADLDTLVSAQPSVGAGPGVAADLVVINARVLTIDPAMPRAEAFAIKN